MPLALEKGEAEFRYLTINLQNVNAVSLKPRAYCSLENAFSSIRVFIFIGSLAINKIVKN